MKKVLANVKTYHLSGGGISIDFSQKGANQYELAYSDVNGEIKFSGGMIDVKKTGMGTLVTVMLEQVPDLYTLILTLVIPDANIDQNSKSIPVKTFAVKTKTKSSIIGPQLINGQIQEYQIQNLKGNAW